MKPPMENNRKTLHVFTVSILLLAGSIILANAQTPEQIIQDALKSTVVLEMTSATGKNSQATGFFIKPRLIATNYHVIEEATKGTAKLVYTKREYDIEGTVAIDKEHDLAILKVADLSAPPLRLGDSNSVQRAEPVYAIGNPRGLEGTVSEGIISNIQGRMIQMTAPISQGSSGGAVLNEKGKVIGIAASVRNDGQNLNFAIPVNHLKTLIGRAGAVKPFAVDPQSLQKNAVPSKNIVFGLLNLLVFSLTVLGVIYFLPTVKINSSTAAVAIAFGLGVIKIAGIEVIEGALAPLLSDQAKAFFAAPPPDDIIHALECGDCFPKLLLVFAKLPVYITALAFLLGIANKAFRQFELNGFFNTFFVALLIVTAEGLLNKFLPFT